MNIKTWLLIFKRFVAVLTRQLHSGHRLDHLAPHVVSICLDGQQKPSGEETIKQKEPCKEPPGWYVGLKRSYDSLSHHVAKSLCWKQRTSNAGQLRTSTPSWQSCHPICNVSDWLQQSATPHRPSSSVMLQSGEESRGNANWARLYMFSVCLCASVPEMQRTHWNRKSRQAFILRNFLPVRCVSLRFYREGKTEEDEKVLPVFQDWFLAEHSSQGLVMWLRASLRFCKTVLPSVPKQPFPSLKFLANKSSYPQRNDSQFQYIQRELAKEKTEAKSSWLLWLLTCVCTKYPVAFCGLYLLSVPKR